MESNQRYYARLAKAIRNCPYTYMADQIGISHSSMYNWLSYQFELSPIKQKQLGNLLDALLKGIIIEEETE